MKTKQIKKSSPFPCTEYKQKNGKTKFSAVVYDVDESGEFSFSNNDYHDGAANGNIDDWMEWAESRMCLYAEAVDFLREIKEQRAKEKTNDRKQYS